METFLDISNAFEKVWNTVLIFKLKLYGVDDTLLINGKLINRSSAKSYFKISVLFVEKYINDYNNYNKISRSKYIFGKKQDDKYYLQLYIQTFFPNFIFKMEIEFGK